MYKFRGHTFTDSVTCSCCVGDVKQGRRDPTGTIGLQRKFNSTLQIAWRQVKRAVAKMVIDQDILSLKSAGLFQVVQPSVTAGGSKVLAFQRWFDYLLANAVAPRSGEAMRPFIQRAYSQGVDYAQQELEQAIFVPGILNHRLDTLQALAFVEMQGINEAVSQQAVRAVSYGLLHNDSPKKIAQAINERIDAIGAVRTQAMVSFVTVKAFNEATLDVYEAAKIERVDLVPESVAAKVTTDAKRKTGPGSRSSRKQTPSRSTIQRIKRVERSLEKLGKVNVLTAEDDRVCPVCEDISEDGPYTINKARSLIPAHVRCRCVFVPVKDKRYAGNK